MPASSASSAVQRKTCSDRMTIGLVYGYTRLRNQRPIRGAHGWAFRIRHWFIGHKWLLQKSELHRLGRCVGLGKLDGVSAGQLKLKKDCLCCFKTWRNHDDYDLVDADHHVNSKVCHAVFYFKLRKIWHGGTDKFRHFVAGSGTLRWKVLCDSYEIHAAPLKLIL